jgi:hypothetical protein
MHIIFSTFNCERWEDFLKCFWGAGPKTNCRSFWQAVKVERGGSDSSKEVAQPCSNW